MKIAKKIIALGLVFIMALAFTGCHKKNEIAVTIGDVEFTSAYYMCALISADSEAQAEVQEQLSDDESTEDIDYYSQKIDGKSYVDWVEDRAIEKLKEIAAYKTLCKQNNLEFDQEDVEQTEYYISMYWSSYGYSEYFEPNGVSEQTFLQFNIDSDYSSLYFDFLYGEGGEKEIASDEVAQKIYDTFVTANLLTVTFSEETDTEKAEIKTKLEGYVTDLTKGKKTFEEVYHEYTETEADHTDESEDTSDTEESQPLDPHASIFGPEDTNYAFDYYDDIKAMATGEVKLIEQEDSAGYYLVVKKDIKSDPYYLEYLDSTVRHMLADEEYEKDMEEYYTSLEADINKYAVGQFKVKKIKYPE